MKIAFCITGAGHLLEQSVKLAEKLSQKNDLTIFLSAAAVEVLKMYGFYKKISMLCGGKYNELYTEANQKFSYPITGRLSLGKYDLLIVTPATANTVSKIVYGIADSLVTNAVAQAGKGSVDIFIVPVDYYPGETKTVLPSKLELSLCKNCDKCIPALTCKNGAIIPASEIDLTKCTGCGLCKNSCPNGAINSGKIITIYMRDIDIENTEKLSQMKGIKIFEKPSDILEYI